MDPNFNPGLNLEAGHKRELMQTILDRSSIVVVAFDSNGTCLILNAAGRQFFGLNSEQSIKDLDIGTIHEWDYSGLKNLTAIAFETKCEQRVETKWPLENGGNLWVNAHLIPYVVNEETRVVIMLEDNTLPHLFNENLEFKLNTQNQALNDSESKYYSLADALPEIVFTVNSDNKVTYLNHFGQNLTGFKEQNFVGESLQRIFDGEMDPSITLDVENILQTHKPHNQEYIIRKENKTLWLSFQLTPLFHKNNGAISILGIGRDITANKAAEEQLKYSRHLFRLIIDNIPQRIFWKDTQSRYIGYNEAFRLDQRIENPEGIIGKSDLDLSWKEMAEYYQVEEQSIIENDTPKLEYQELRRMPEGHMLWVRASKVPLHDSEGKTFGILGTYNDITDEKWMEAHLKENELRFRSTFEQAAVGIAHVSPQDQFIIVNQRFCEIVEYTKIELGTLGLEVLTCPEDQQIIHNVLKRIINSERSNFQIETKFQKKNNQFVWVQLTVSRVMNPQGIVQFWVAVIEDISERILASAMLSQQSKELTRANQLIGSLSKVSSRLEPTRTPSQVMETLGKELRKLNIFIQIALRTDNNDLFEIKYSSLPKQIVRKVEALLHKKLVGYKFNLQKASIKLPTKETPIVFASEISNLLDRLPNNPDWRRELLPSLDFLNQKALIFSLPLQIGDRDLGLFEFWGSGIQNTDIPAFTVFANQVAAALEASRLYQEIAHQAILDDLTGLLNRRGFFALSEQQIRLQSRLSNYLNLVYIDLDDFKKINDSFGHQVGDQALIDVAEILRRCFRNADIIGRIGGDEFVILTIAKEPVEPGSLQDRLVERFVEFNATNNRPYQLKFSVGSVSCQLCSDTSLDDWLAQADNMMYEEKRKNKSKRLNDTM